VDTRSDELNHISDWAQNKNLKLNLAKSQKIIFVDKQRKHNFAVPSKLKEIQQVDALKILDVTVTNGLSVSLHIQTVISSCAQTLYALRVLRAHGLHDSASTISIDLSFSLSCCMRRFVQFLDRLL